MDNKIEEIKQALDDAPRFELQHGTKVVNWLRYLLDQYEQQQAEIETLKRVAADDHAVYKWNFVVLEDQLSREREEHSQSREENEHLQAENTHLRGLYERERAIADSADTKYMKLEDRYREVKTERDDYRKDWEETVGISEFYKLAGLEDNPDDQKTDRGDE